jgi:type I restriction enzyme S subunit
MNRAPTSSWLEVAVGDVCEFKYGKGLPEANRSGGNVPVFGSNGLVGFHDVALTAGPTIVIGRKGSYGEVNYSSVPCWPIDTTYYVDSTATKEDLRWLMYRLSALSLNKLNRAAAVPGLNREDAYRLRFLLPPRPEQRRIADILDKANELRARRRSALKKLDELTHSIFLDMFGDPATNPKGLSMELLGEHLRFVTSGSRGWARFYVSTGSRFIRSLDVQMNSIGSEDMAFVAAPNNAEARRTQVATGDVLLTITGSRIGRVASVLKELEGSYISQHVAILRVDSTCIEPDFLSFFLSLDSGDSAKLRNFSMAKQSQA